MPPRATNGTSRVWLITGCSAGLGFILAQALCEIGEKVIATARNLSSLGELKDIPGIKTLELDVTSSQEVLDAKAKEAISYHGHIDILVNNAGYVLSGVWEQLSQDSVYHQLDTNVFGPLRLTRAILPFMRQRKGGSIVFIGSIAGWVGAAACGPYAVSKFALEGAVECLQKEIAQFNIQTYLFILGQFRTGVLDANRRKYDLDETLPEYKDMINALKERHADTHGKQRGNPHVAVQRIIHVLVRNKAIASQVDSPTRIFLGPDCVNAVKAKCEATLKSLEEHSDFFCSTDYPEQPQIAGYK